MESRKVQPPFHLPHMTMEWKRQPDLIWLLSTGLAKYYTLLEGKINIRHCTEFVNSMGTRSEEETYPSGVVEGVLVEYSSRYLHNFFGWDGLGATTRSEECRHPPPDVAACVGDLELKKDGGFDVFALGNHMKDPWFSRMRGLLSQVYFQNNCNGILLAQLSLLLLADSKDNLGTHGRGKLPHLAAGIQEAPGL